MAHGGRGVPLNRRAGVGDRGRRGSDADRSRDHGRGRAELRDPRRRVHRTDARCRRVLPGLASLFARRRGDEARAPAVHRARHRARRRAPGFRFRRPHTRLDDERSRRLHRSGPALVVHRGGQRDRGRRDAAARRLRRRRERRDLVVGGLRRGARRHPRAGDLPERDPLALQWKRSGAGRLRKRTRLQHPDRSVHRQLGRVVERRRRALVQRHVRAALRGRNAGTARDLRVPGRRHDAASHLRLHRLLLLRPRRRLLLHRLLRRPRHLRRRHRPFRRVAYRRSSASS